MYAESQSLEFLYKRVQIETYIFYYVHVYKRVQIETCISIMYMYIKECK